MPRSTKLWMCLAAGLVLFAGVSWLSVSVAKEKETGKPMIVHDVYFQLTDNSPEARQRLVASCKKYLTDHAGTAYFSAGVLSEELNREVNDRDWDVGLHIVFKTKADHDVYQTHPRHEQFIAEQKSNWKKVRVFDTDVD